FITNAQSGKRRHEKRMGYDKLHHFVFGNIQIMKQHIKGWYQNNVPSGSYKTGIITHQSPY
ncbi:MAG: hypothetical protein ACK5GV_02285, partial [Bacteroidota bacterium]